MIKNNRLLSLFLIMGVVLCLFFLLYLKQFRSIELANSSQKKEQAKISSAAQDPLLRGKIDHYDQEQQLLYLQTDEQLLSFPLSMASVIYCWPTTQNGVQISEAYLPLGPGQVIYIEGESKTTLDQLNLAELAAKYVFLQQDQNRQLVKATIINCYE